MTQLLTSVGRAGGHPAVVGRQSSVPLSKVCLLSRGVLSDGGIGDSSVVLGLESHSVTPLIGGAQGVRLERRERENN